MFEESFIKDEDGTVHMVSQPIMDSNDESDAIKTTKEDREKILEKLDQGDYQGRCFG